MSIESDLFDGVSGALGHDRVFPPPLPNGILFPAVTYARITTGRIRSHDGTSAVRPLFQLSCWDPSAKTASEVARELISYFEDARCLIQDDRGPFWEEGANVHRRDLDVLVWATLDEEVSASS